MAKAPKKYQIEDTIMIDKIYSIGNKNMPNNISKLKNCIEKFVHERHDELYDYAPMKRIFFTKKDRQAFFTAIGVKEKDVSDILPELYYWKEDELQACKDEFSITMMMILRYLIKNKRDPKIIELAYMYLAFSGKFYASCHYQFFRYPPKKEVMDYVVNYMMSQKFDLAKYKSLWGAIKSLTSTWIDTYKDELCADDITDERVVYIIHQLYNRIYAFMRNIAKLYYEANDKKLYINAESDDYSKDNYRIANNNSTVAAAITEKTMVYMTSTQVNLTTCYQVSSSGVDPKEIKAIFENIMNSDNEHLDQLRYVINVLIVDFMKNYPQEQDITGTKFIAHSITMKPNSKDKDILKMKEVVHGWLNTSERYKSIKTQMTKNNYYKAILGYIAITVNKANK